MAVHKSNKVPDKMSPESAVLLALVAALPMVFASGFTAYEVLKTAVFVGGGGALVAMFAVRALRKQRVGLRAVFVMLPLLALALVAAISALWAPNPWRAGLGAAHWFALAGVLAATLNPVVRKPKFEVFALALAAGTGLSALVGLLGALGVTIDAAAPGRAADGLRATFDHERYAAISLAVATPVLAAGIGVAKGPIRITLAVALALLGVFIGFANITDAYLALGMGLAVSFGFVALTRGAPKSLEAKLMGGAVATLAAVIAVSAVLAPLKPYEGDAVRFETMDKKVAVRTVDWGRPDPPVTSDARAFARTGALRAFKAAPIFGVGADNLDGLVMGYADWASPHYKSTVEPYPAFRAAHNGYLQLMAELGLVGLALFVSTVVLGLIVIARGLKGSGPAENPALDDVEILGLVAVVTASLLGFAFEQTLTLSFSATLFFVAFGLLLANAAERGPAVGLAKQWLLSKPGIGGIGTFERLFVVGAAPLLVAILAVALVGATAASDYFKAKGDVFVGAGDLDRAGPAYRQALEIDPDNDLARLNLGHVLEVRGDKNEAERELLRTLGLRPNDVRIFSTLGQIQMNLSLAVGRKKMEERLKGTAETPPEEVSPTELIDNVDKTQMSRAEYNAKRAIELHPRYVKAYLDLSNLYMTQKKVDESQTALLKALEQAEGNPTLSAEIHTRVGRGYLVDEKWDLAQKHLTAALELDPGHPRSKAVMRDLQRAESRGKGPQEGGDEHDGH